MKLTVLQWEKVQNGTPESEEGNALYDKIEDRTRGKSYQANCAIALNAAEQKMVDAIVQKRTAEGRFDPHFRD